MDTQKWKFLDDHNDYIPRIVLDQEFVANQYLGDFSPYHLFSLYFSDDYLQTIVTMTNEHANEYIRNNTEYLRTHKNSIVNKWHDIDVEELKKFLAVILLSGVINNRRLSDNWSGGEFLKSSIKNIMSYKLFQLINKFIRISDESARFTKDRKVLDLINHFNRVAPSLSNYDSNLTIDELLYPFKGRLSFRQYIKSKPYRYGMKYFLLASSSTGYLYKMQLYTGKEKRIVKRDINYAHEVIESLISGITTPKTIFIDSWWCSLEVIDYLNEKEWGVVGVLPKTRLKDREMRELRIDKNAFTYFTNINKPELLMTVFHDKKQFFLVSNCIAMQERIDDDQKPNTVSKYIKMARGVDLNNQLCSSYRMKNRTKRWSRKVLRYVAEACVTNCFIIYKQFTPITHLDFLIAVIDGLRYNL